MGTNERKKRAHRRQIAFLVLLAVLIPFGISQYYKWSAESGLFKVWFDNPDGNSTIRFKVEAASTPAEVKKGLMFRKSLAPDRGMIFVFPTEKDQGFWMKNTFVSLDMIFIGTDFKVVGILENVPKMSEQTRSVGAPSQYVLELPAGSSKKHGIVKGSWLRKDRALPKAL